MFSNDLISLKSLALLSEQYALNSNTIFVPDKTKLIAFTDPKLAHIPQIESFLTPITISDKVIPLSHTADHVGIVRNSTSISPHILDRISAHKKANAILKYAGSGGNNRTSLLASIRAEQCFCTPVLLSGMASLVIDKPLMNIFFIFIYLTQ